MTIPFPAKCRRHLRALALEQGEDFTRTPQHRRGEASKPADLDAVRAIGTTRLQAMEEQHLRRRSLWAGDLSDGNVIVADCV